MQFLSCDVHPRVMDSGKDLLEAHLVMRINSTSG